MDKPKEISVLVADDSSVTRKIVSDLLIANRINVVGEAINGIEALQMINELNPDVVVLDIWMPQKNGLEVLRDIFNRRQAKESPEKNIPRAVVLSCLIDSDEDIALRCLRLGAVTCIAKPKEGILHTEDFSQDLIRAVKEAYAARPRFNKILQEKSPVKNQPKVDLLNPIKDKPALIAIGSSTGGPQIIEELITKLPASFNIPLVVVQHLPKGFTRRFAERLDRTGEIKVSEAKSGDSIEPQSVYIAPGGLNIALNGKNIYFDDSDNFRIKPSIDCFFASAAKLYKDKFIGIILSGMGGDAILGAQAVKENGGWLIVQDPETCMIDGMVKDIIERKLADEILTPEKILERLISLSA
ncbi:MAG TPA: chemotaxis-specific protein-glutamate methyltransferase CheB [Patescibacteria group bacterium]|nr:chemotaxis-specific protein-glutamate methyltransferase CheB [Patescibacteria group bacterium]